MAGKKKKLCTRHTKINIINTCPSNNRSFGYNADSNVIFNGHRYTYSEQSIEIEIKTTVGCKQAPNAIDLCEISWREWSPWTKRFRHINIWQPKWDGNRFVHVRFDCGFHAYQSIVYQLELKTKTHSNRLLAIDIVSPWRNLIVMSEILCYMLLMLIVAHKIVFCLFSNFAYRLFKSQQ